MDIRVTALPFLMMPFVTTPLLAEDAQHPAKHAAATTTLTADLCTDKYPELAPRFEAAIDSFKSENADLVPPELWNSELLSDDVISFYKSRSSGATLEFCSKKAATYESQVFHSQVRVYLEAKLKYSR